MKMLTLAVIGLLLALSVSVAAAQARSGGIHAPATSDFGSGQRDPSGGIGVYRDPSTFLGPRPPLPIYQPGAVVTPPGGMIDQPPITVIDPSSEVVWVPPFWAWDGFGWVLVPGHWANR